MPAPARARSWSAALLREPAVAALLALAAAAWLLVTLARAGWFAAWWSALPLLAAAAALGALAWSRLARADKLTTALLALLVLLLVAPPAQQVALSGDAGIYANEAAWLARTGGVVGPYTPLDLLSPATRDLFVIESSEQFDGRYTVQSYDGIIYGGYYVVEPGDAATPPTVRQSRAPQTSAWQALLIKLFGLPANFWLGAAAGVLSLWLLWAIGRRIAPRWVAIWGALALAISLPQLYLMRSALSEPVGQVWTLAGLLCAVRWLQDGPPRRPWLLLCAPFFWMTAWSARIDAALLVGPALLLLLEAARRRDRAGLRAALLALPVLALLAVWGTNPPYTNATVELFSRIEPLFLPALGALALAGPLLMAVLWRWGEGLTALYRRFDWAAHLLLFLPAAFVVLWSTLPNPWRVEGVTRAFQEIPWFSSASLTPLLYWLALAGMAVILWRKPGAAQGFLLLSLLGLGAAYFLDYTSAPLYPISLRRLAADLIPLLVLVAGQALVPLAPPAAADWRRWLPAAQVAVAAAALLWMGMRSAPLWNMREARDDVAFLATLNAQLPENAVLLFEPQDGDSWIGWLAAPLFSFHSRDALLLESDTPDPALLAAAIEQLEAGGRAVILASQSDPLPAALLPPGAGAAPLYATTWESAQIGQVRTPWPPVYWEFALPLHLYRVTMANAPQATP